MKGRKEERETDSILCTRKKPKIKLTETFLTHHM